MSDRLQNAFTLLRQGGAVFAGRARLTGWSHSIRGQSVSFRLDVSKDPSENPPAHPFLGAYASQKDGEEFMILVIPVASGPADVVDQTGALETKDVSTGDGENQPVSSTNHDKRKWAEMPFSQRAAVMCQPPRDGRRFVLPDFLREHYAYDFGRAGSDPTACLRLICGVNSRTELDRDPEKAERFLALHSEFLAWNDAGQAA